MLSSSFSRAWHFLRRRLTCPGVAACAFLLGGPAYAASTCDTVATTAGSPAGVPLVVPRNSVAGQLLGSYTVTYTVNCSGLSDPGETWQLLQYRVKNDTQNVLETWGVYVQAVDNGTLYAGPDACQTAPSNPGTPHIGWSFWNTTTGLCKFQVTVQLNFYALGIGIGNFPPNLNVRQGHQIVRTISGASTSYAYTRTPMPTRVYATTTCFIQGAANFAVTLPTVGTNALSSPGSVAATTPFVIRLRDCTDPAGLPYVASTNWSFTAGASTASVSNVDPAPAGQVEVQLLDSNLNVIQTGTASTLTINATGNYVLQYYARYLATGAATPGGVRAVVQYTMSYL